MLTRLNLLEKYLYLIFKQDEFTLDQKNMTEDFSPKALVVVERLWELIGLGGVASLLLILLKIWVT